MKKKINSKSITRTGYLATKETIKGTWFELELGRRDLWDAMVCKKSWCTDGSRKVRVTITLTVEELE